MRYIRMIIVGIFALTLMAFMTSTAMIKNKDTENPIITSDTDQVQISVAEGEKGLLQGLKATDNIDGDITDQIFVGKRFPFTEKGTCKVKYVVFDSSNNVGSYMRTVTYTDYASPEFHLSQPLIYEIGETVTILDRLSVSDSLEGDISDKIKIVSSDINKSEPGVYRIVVEATNRFGDIVSASLPVNVVEMVPDMPNIELTQYMATIQQGNKFDALKYVKDVVLPDGNRGAISEVRMESDVDTQTPGTYQVVYSYTENGGNTGITSLTVVVRE